MKNRAEVAKIIGTSIHIEDTVAFNNCENPFDDVSDGTWYTKYVASLSRLDHGDGVAVLAPSGSFNPGADPTRCEVLKMIVEAWDLDKVSANPNFSDIGDIPAWCLPYVKAGVAHGIVSNGTGKFNPNDVSDAGMTAVMISSAINDHGRPTPSPDDFDHSSCVGSGDCTNDCVPSGDRKCDGSSYFKVCGDYDANDCLEWSSKQPCAAGQTCSDGNCSGPVCGDGECDSGDGETCSSCPSDCGSCNYCGDGQCTASAGENCTTCSTDCGTCLVLYPGAITSPSNGSVVSNQEFQINWYEGYASTGNLTSTALYCKLNNGPWDMKVGFGYVPPYTFHDAPPGASLSCKVRTRLNNDYDNWVDSDVSSWTVDSDYAAIVVTGVEISPDYPQPNGCEDLFFNATFKNNGSQEGTWRAHGFLHPAGEDETSPEAVETWWDENVNLAPQQEVEKEFRIDLPIPLPLSGGTWEITVIVEDLYNNNYGTPSRMTIPAYGDDVAPPEALYLKVWGYGGDPEEVLPGKQHTIILAARDDYALDTWKLSWRPPGGAWTDISIEQHPTGHCREELASSAHWLVPESLDAELLLDLRFQITDLDGNLTEKFDQVLTRSTAEPTVTFIKPVGGELYVESNGEEYVCAPVEFIVVAGVEIDAIRIGWTNNQQTALYGQKTFYDKPQGGQFEYCLQTNHAGNQLRVFVEVEDVNAQEHVFVSPIVVVDFPPPQAPWGPIVVELTQTALPKPSFSSSGVDSFYSTMRVSGGAVSLYRKEERWWTDSSVKYGELTIRELVFGAENFSLQATSTYLPTTVEQIPEDYQAGIRFLNPKPQMLHYMLTRWTVDDTVCNDPFNQVCDYDFFYRDVTGGAVSDLQFVGKYEDRIYWDQPSLRHFLVSPSGTKVLFVDNDDSDSQNYRTDLFRQSGQSWNFVWTSSRNVLEAFVAEGKMWGIDAPENGQGNLDLRNFEINENAGEVGNSAVVGTWDSTGFKPWTFKDLHSDAWYLFVYSYDSWEYRLYRFESGTWTLLTSSVLPSLWRGKEVSQYAPVHLIASHGKIALFIQVSTVSGWEYLVKVFDPSDSIVLEDAFTGISSDQAWLERIAIDESGRLFQTNEYCQWNLENRLCFQRSHLGAGDCYDDDPCTDEDWNPISGTCSHDPKVCEGNGDVCNGTWYCDPTTGECVVDPSSIITCDDGLFCNGQETCDPATGECIEGTPPELDDGFSCTAGTCDEGTDVVVHQAIEDACISDACHETHCDPTDSEAALETGCVTTPLPTVEDGLDCTLDTCNPVTGQPVYAVLSGFCLIEGECRDEGILNPDNVCQVCNPVASPYAWSPGNEGQTCDDELYCTVDDACSSGQCTGNPRSCDHLADDLFCQMVWCEEAVQSCIVASLEDGIPCNDGDLCTSAETCSGGTCVGVTKICDDENVCSDDHCIPSTGDCLYIPNEANCDDGNNCTEMDSCWSGLCTGVEIICDDEVDCTEDICVPTGDCVSIPNPELCDFGDYCQTGTCTEIGCVYEPVACDDSNECTIDSCDSSVGCQHVATICVDADICTDDGCDPITGECVFPPNSSQCDDGVPCTVDDICSNGECVGQPKDCDDGDLCTSDACDPLTGECSSFPLDCYDGNPCTDDMCGPMEGCKYILKDCDDQDLCTIDSCDPSNGQCTNTQIVCDDYNPCTTDICVEGACHHEMQPACPTCVVDGDCIPSDLCHDGQCEDSTGNCLYPLKDCDDGNACTDDSCDLGTGECTNSTIVCDDDEDPCTVDDCDPVQGCTYSDVDCDDGSNCTTDSCDPVTGQCLNEPEPDCSICVTDIDCDDGDLCTADSCNLKLSVCSNVPKDCNDVILCTTDLCDPFTGDCENVPVDCDDDDSCTDDSCDSASGDCTYSPVVCNDSDACTEDFCEQSSGCQFLQKECDDQNECTNDSCDPVTGNCIQASKDCDDYNPCTEDSCSDGVCQHVMQTSCPTCVVDGDCVSPDLCHLGQCDSIGGTCLYPPKNCGDGNACTDDSCDLGTGDCVHTIITCDDDGDLCTLDNCDPVNGCTYPDVDCGDGNNCTIDSCNPTTGSCLNILKDCSDGNPCTDDGCMAGGTCFSTPNSSSCDDGNPCTLTDTCQAGNCIGSNLMVCEAIGQCHYKGICQPDTGTCTMPLKPDLNPCDDGNPCTQKDQCQSGVCNGSSPVQCLPIDQCHEAGVCDPATGTCSNPMKTDGIVCDDGDECTGFSTCLSGLCIGKEPVVCVALDQCHEMGVCDPVSGKCSSPVKDDGAPCDAGEPCLTGDSCVEGICVQGNELVCACASDADCVDDGDKCNGTLGCVTDPESGMNYCEQLTTEIVCEDSEPDDCVDIVCIPLTGFCEAKQSKALSPCDDGDPCTLNDQCYESGDCVGIQNPDCLPKPDEASAETVEKIPDIGKPETSDQGGGLDLTISDIQDAGSPEPDTKQDAGGGSGGGLCSVSSGDSSVPFGPIVVLLALLIVALRGVQKARRIDL